LIGSLAGWRFESDHALRNKGQVQIRLAIERIDQPLHLAVGGVDDDEVDRTSIGDRLQGGHVGATVPGGEI
jgi:hypothetical protein